MLCHILVLIIGLIRKRRLQNKENKRKCQLKIEPYNNNIIKIGVILITDTPPSCQNYQLNI